eukprot:TRINITY_DN25300_c0_g1_i1.p2 TRINITY_DN25300_c0_g1~~TRINITY_DN25300_c0_g1_i1.p2  ORF type:complete len:509 (+),score=70.56 TRINITY_DN25300_c0_g1_i1:69-1529(+)
MLGPRCDGPLEAMAAAVRHLHSRALWPLAVCLQELGAGCQKCPSRADPLRSLRTGDRTEETLRLLRADTDHIAALARWLRGDAAPRKRGGSFAPAQPRSGSPRASPPAELRCPSMPAAWSARSGSSGASADGPPADAAPAADSSVPAEQEPPTRQPTAVIPTATAAGATASSHSACSSEVLASLSAARQGLLQSAVSVSFPITERGGPLAVASAGRPVPLPPPPGQQPLGRPQSPPRRSDLQLLQSKQQEAARALRLVSRAAGLPPPALGDGDCLAAAVRIAEAVCELRLAAARGADALQLSPKFCGAHSRIPVQPQLEATGHIAMPPDRTRPACKRAQPRGEPVLWGEPTVTVLITDGGDAPAVPQMPPQVRRRPTTARPRPHPPPPREGAPERPARPGTAPHRAPFDPNRPQPLWPSARGPLMLRPTLAVSLPGQQFADGGSCMQSPRRHQQKQIAERGFGIHGTQFGPPELSLGPRSECSAEG